MRRLDSPLSTIIHKWTAYIGIVVLWGAVLKDYLTGNPSQMERATPVLLYVLPPITLFCLWWFQSFKKVTLDKDTLIVCGFSREARIPVSQIEKVHECPNLKGMAHLIIKFKAKTEFGWRVRVMIGSSRTDVTKAAKLVRDAIDGKISGVKINQVSKEAPDAAACHQKEVNVRGWTDEELAKILNDFADMYQDALGNNYEFNVCPLSQGATRISFPRDIPAKEFSFLVNYLNYPKDFDLKGRSLSITGRATLSSAFHPPSKSLLGKRAIFYVPANDEQFDLVYIHVGNETFKNSFSSRHWQKVEDSRIPSGIEMQND